MNDISPYGHLGNGGWVQFLYTIARFNFRKKKALYQQKLYIFFLLALDMIKTKAPETLDI